MFDIVILNRYWKRDARTLLRASRCKNTSISEAKENPTKIGKNKAHR